jgi:hypothetical protein
MKHLKTFKEALEVDFLGKLQMPDYLTCGAEDDEDYAFDKGREAKENDCDIEENPYEEGDPLRFAWEDGFNE